MKLKSFHWTRRTVVYALIGLAVLLALAVIWRSNGGVLSAHYNVTTTDGRIAYLQALGWEADPATETAQEIVIPRCHRALTGNCSPLRRCSFSRFQLRDNLQKFGKLSDYLTKFRKLFTKNDHFSIEKCT